MSLRVRIFLWVGGLFALAITLVTFVREFQIRSNLSHAEMEIAKQIRVSEKYRQDNMLHFLQTNIAKIESEIDSFFERMIRYKWFGGKEESDDWLTVSLLMAVDHWIDLTKISHDGKQTALEVSHPPYLERYFVDPIEEDLAIIISEDEKGVFTPWIGKGFNQKEKIFDWNESKLPQPRDSFESETKWLFYSLEQIFSGKIPELQERLKNHQDLIEIIQDRNKFQEWVKNKDFGEKKAWDPPPCEDDYCDLRYVSLVENWNHRRLQKHLAWNFVVMTQSKLFLDDSPFGIVATVKYDDYQGYGFFKRHVFKEKEISIPGECSGSSIVPQVTKKLEIVFPENIEAAFLVGSFCKEGVFTLGVNMNPFLRELAIASYTKILFMSKDGRILEYNEEGEVKVLNHQDLPYLKKMLKEKSGFFNPNGDESAFFLHLTDLSDGDGRVFIIEAKENAFFLIKELKKHASFLLHTAKWQLIFAMAFATLVVLIVVNHILKRMLKPIKQLAESADQVRTGHLDHIKIAQSGKDRKDEVGTLCNSFERMIEGMKQGEKVRDILNKVVSKEIADRIISEGVELGGEVRETTILFSDIRQFTVITEEMHPQDVLEMLNGCLNVLSHIVDEFEGVIDKYVGDEIMALFGAPLDVDRHAVQAILCAKAMVNVLSDWNHQRKQRGAIPLNIGIAIHTGQVVAGNIGAENHLSYTVLGHNVNLASRICDIAGPMEILITEATLNAPGVKEVITYEALPPKKLIGIREPVQLFRVNP